MQNTVYETENKVLEFVYKNMKCNLLHILTLKNVASCTLHQTVMI